jgi:TfoX/Sxy family transcriptional regulator of competence genes
MPTAEHFIEFLRDQLRGTDVSFRKMFGEYALYCEGKVVALACDNQLFVKPTPAGRALLSEVAEAPPYPGAKPHYLIGDLLEDRVALQDLLRRTAAALPLPPPRTPRAARKEKRPAKG